MATEKKDTPPSTTLVRVRTKTANLLRHQGRTMDLAVMNLWNKVLSQSKELKEWKTATGYPSLAKFYKAKAVREEQDV